MLKVLKSCAAALAVCGLFMAAAPQANAADKILIRLSHTGSEGNEYSKGYEKFKELLEKKTDGKVEVRIYPNSVLGADSVSGQAVQQGNLEAASVATNILSTFHQSALPFDMPYVTTIDKMEPYLNDLAYGDLNKYLVEKLAEVDLYPFMFNATPMRSWAFTKKDVQNVGDLKGIKVRSTPSAIDVANCKAVGMNPTTLSLDQTYPAMQQGVVDGELISFSSIEAWDRKDILRHVYATLHNFPIHVGLMQKSYFDSLPSDVQQAIMEAAKEAQEWEWQILQDGEKSGIEYCEANDIKIVYPTPEQIEELKKDFQVVWDEFGPQLDPKMLELLQATQK